MHFTVEAFQASTGKRQSPYAELSHDAVLHMTFAKPRV